MCGMDSDTNKQLRNILRGAILLGLVLDTLADLGLETSLDSVD